MCCLCCVYSVCLASRKLYNCSIVDAVGVDLDRLYHMRTPITCHTKLTKHLWVNVYSALCNASLYANYHVRTILSLYKICGWWTSDYCRKGNVKCGRNHDLGWWKSAKTLSLKCNYNFSVEIKVSEKIWKKVLRGIKTAIRTKCFLRFLIDPARSEFLLSRQFRLLLTHTHKFNQSCCMDY